MRKSMKWILCATSLLLSVTGWSQEFPKAEVGFDYSYVRYAPSAIFTKGHSLNGGGGNLVFNVNKYLGLKADLQGYGSTTSNFVITPRPLFPAGAVANVQGNLFTYLFGPQIKVRTPKFQPFVHLLFGGAHSNVYANAFKAICTPRLGACAFSGAPSSNAFAMAFGGGIDIPVGHVVSIRPAEVDYLLTNFSNRFNNSNQNNFRYSGGINFNLGGQSQ
jgi:hypothetical protein